MPDHEPPNFKISFTAVKADSQFMAVAFQCFINAGTALHTIPLTDIHIYIPPGRETPFSLEDLLSWGNLIGDSVFFLQIYEEDRRATDGFTTSDDGRFLLMITDDPSDTLRPAMSPDSAAKLVAAWAIYAMVRAGPPSKPMPKFVKDQIGMTLSPDEMCKQFTSTSVANWSLEWIKNVQWSQIGQETLSRFGLGVAGYRLIQPFKLYEPRADCTQAIKDACSLMRIIALKPAAWEVHPVTRDPNLLTTLGNVNKNCMNLILAAFTPQQIAEMQGRAISTAVQPSHDAQHVNFRTWTPAMASQLTFTNIF